MFKYKLNTHSQFCECLDHWLEGSDVGSGCVDAQRRPGVHPVHAVRHQHLANVHVANKGASDADITVDAIDNNGNSYKFPGGVAKKGAVTELSGKIDSGLAAAGFTSGKVAITLTFTAPDTVIEVYSAYNVGGSDRGTVVNSSNGRSFFYGTGVNMNDFKNN